MVLLPLFDGAFGKAFILIQKRRIMAKFNHLDIRGTKRVPSAFGNVFFCSGTTADAKTITFPDGFLNGTTPEPNLAFKVVFPNGHNAANASSYLSLNGVVVVSNQKGTLAPIPVHAMSEGGSTVYKVLDPNTTLELYYTADYDGNGTPAFVIIGNPIVLSSTDYAIYADGQKECLKVGAQYTSTIVTTYSTSWTSANFVFSDVPKGKYQVGWAFFPGINFSGVAAVNGKISIVLDYAYNGGYYQTTEIIDAPGGQLTYACEISVNDAHGANFVCVFTRIA